MHCLPPRPAPPLCDAAARRIIYSPIHFPAALETHLLSLLSGPFGPPRRPGRVCTANAADVDVILGHLPKRRAEGLGGGALVAGPPPTAGCLPGRVPRPEAGYRGAVLVVQS